MHVNGTDEWEVQLEATLSSLSGHEKTRMIRKTTMHAEIASTVAKQPLNLTRIALATLRIYRESTVRVQDCRGPLKALLMTRYDNRA